MNDLPFRKIDMMKEVSDSCAKMSEIVKRIKAAATRSDKNTEAIEKLEKELNETFKEMKRKVM